MAQKRPPPAFYDFSTFQHAPGVAAEIRKYGAPQIVDIPQTTIPSPLAPDLSPDTVAGLKQRLVGDASAKGRSRGESAGAEVWASWKRAWDLWNNHYIEGRVSPVWIREEYERLKKEMGEARDERRREAEMNRFKTRYVPRRPTKPIARATVFSREKPEAASGKVYKRTNETRPARNAIVKKMLSRPKPGSIRVFKRKGEKVPVYGERFVTEIVRVERVVPRDPKPLSSWKDLVADSKAQILPSDGSAEPESTDTVTEITLEERQVMEFGHVDVFGDKVSPKVMSSEEVTQYMKDHGTLPRKDEETDEKNRFVSQRPQMWHPVTEPCLEGERILTVDETVPIIEFEDRLVDVLEEDDEAVLIGWVEEDEDAAMDDADDDSEDTELHLDGTDDFSRMPMPVVDEEPAVFYKPRHLVEREDHFSGGFFPMKCLDPYPELDDLDGDGNPEWLDALQNTVWRPRQVGENTLRIEVDDLFDEATARKWLEVDGGVDCGRSPYPVLRSVTEYVKIPKDLGGNLSGLFRKKKMWDGVTGTIFNMPTKPPESDEIEDERMSRMQALYGDFFRDNRNKHRHDFFPLDIRRVKRRSDANYPGRQITTPLLEKNETLVRYPWHVPEDQGKDLPPTDPWAVTAEQRRKRDIPVRRHPPAQCCKDKNQVDLLPVDDSIWREEVQDDDYGRWKYFVTNIHGGTLLINGKEIKKNQIAGPLPEFAVIECPGKQVAFWWGPGGRNYLQGQPGYDYEHRWETLRRSDPELEKVALTAGQEWDYKIRVRITKEFTGNEWEDDKQWDEWKKAIGVSEQDVGCDPASPAGTDKTLIHFKKFNKSGIPTGTDIVQPECFPSDKDELRWLHTKAEPLSQAIESYRKETFIDPSQVGKPFFPGSIAPADASEIRAQRMATRAYRVHEQDVIKEQLALNATVAKTKAQRAEREREVSRAIGRKREAESQLQGPFPKKKTLDDLKREARDAEDDLQRQVDNDAAVAEKEQSSTSPSMEYLVRVFDKDVRSSLERKLKDYVQRKIAARNAGQEFTELRPKLEREIEIYLEKRREKERLDRESLEIVKKNRLMAGKACLWHTTEMPPGVDEVYEAWKEELEESEREMEREGVEDRKREQERIKRNREAEEERLRREKIRADDEAKYRRAAAQHRILEEKAAKEEAQMTMAEKAAEKRLANWRAIIANNMAKAKENELAREIADGLKESLSSSLDSSSGRTSQEHVDKGKKSHMVGNESIVDVQPISRVSKGVATALGMSNKVEERRGEVKNFEMAAEGMERKRRSPMLDMYSEVVEGRGGDRGEVGLTL